MGIVVNPVFYALMESDLPEEEKLKIIDKAMEELEQCPQYRFTKNLPLFFSIWGLIFCVALLVVLIWY